ncbi:small ubiquitin-related modifier 3-like [Rhopalosiphum maidis]|uniref:small ubiquitin-related modifier 3-like n=1 Tax=Rhopalosiphum maidis TaxID=43146 RepID=UPI000EFE471E|nr:small ubiquitin-related modifier 3-like [Rhopalosiphum maidis]
MDFERVSINAIRLEFTGTRIVGCWFHSSHCLWRQIQELDTVRQKFPDEKDCRNDVMASTDAIKDCKVYSERINLNVLGQDNVIIQFKIRKITRLRKLMYAYCENTGLAYNSVRFRFEGQPVNEIDTPASLNLEEGDIIEVFQQQTGGCKMLL